MEAAKDFEPGRHGERLALSTLLGIPDPPIWPRSMRRLLLLLFLLCTSSARGQEVIGIDLLTGDVITISVQNGQAAVIGNTGLSFLLWHALARDSSNRLVAGYVDDFARSGTDLYEVSPLNGQVSHIIKTPLAGILGLAFGPGDVLYAINERNPGSSFTTTDLYTIDLATGTPHFIGDTLLTESASLVYGDNTLLSYDGLLGLVRIDPILGTASDVNPGFRGPIDFAESLCFSDEGALFQVDAGFWIQDTLTGVPSFVGPLNYPGILGGIEYLPGPTSPFTLGTLGKTNGQMGLQIWGATPLATVVILMAQGAGGPSSVPAGKPCAGTLINLNASLAPLVILRANAAGRASYGPVFVPAAAARTTHLQALDLAACTTSNPAQIIY